jgi:hypothetical protein
MKKILPAFDTYGIPFINPFNLFNFLFSIKVTPCLFTFAPSPRGFGEHNRGGIYMDSTVIMIRQLAEKQSFYIFFGSASRNFLTPFVNLLF